ncbi:threonine ammonia-lyase, biosynthetic [Granulosicoccus antarcticus]|uniref:L-threonine dehydratase n=1 Tax=Granulosicoccus antarcticus IMCC3135 TaxID=1192854 RepID=A0A2Z2P0U3_9GAMM|nr:threonine ammonia-lyase, biosynthetic [Granulosicoccus antarcticus]ASJ75981.1 L-threonine dehydratase biosynthetic IlvA [Granulosicoccus antarcticus IMCC3135]
MTQLQDEYIKRILSARVYDVSTQTRLHEAPQLSRRLNNQVLLKREDEQPVFSFKCRGAFNRIFKLLEQTPASGVIAASAGNHAQGVALAAQKLGIDAVIVMPQTTPGIKVDAVRALGAEAILHGDDFDTALSFALKLGEERGFPFIHPFDDPNTIAGQGTVAVELCRQHPESLDAVFVPIGGGGLAAGISVYMKYLRPEVRIIGVEPVDAASMHDSLAADERITLPQVGLFADGVAVKQVGEHCFEVCREFLDEVILVTVDEMAAAIKDIFNETRTLTEPAGALAVAGMKRYVKERNVSGQTLIAINSGANINFDRIRHVAERVELGDSREALLAVTIPEKPGSFLAFCKALGKRGITEFNYRYADAGTAHVFAGVELPGGSEERESLMQTLRQSDYDVLDMSRNDTAKLHLRHMIGGHADIASEKLFRFVFPERPGALLHFLTAMGERWNITLFHYRNHGAAYGRVLVGLALPEGDEESLKQFIDELGYKAEDESDNEAYSLFLR